LRCSFFLQGRFANRPYGRVTPGNQIIIITDVIRKSGRKIRRDAGFIVANPHPPAGFAVRINKRR
jgi:hypothetical protein